MMAIEHLHILDHAWWLIAAVREYEPWGFVTEPYVDFETAKRLAKQMSRRHTRWGIDVEALPKDQSAWYPGHTVAIVTTIRPNCLNSFLRFGVGTAMKEMGRVWRDS
jgi:hypothetical protein